MRGNQTNTWARRFALAQALTRGTPIKDVANAAPMTSLGVLDAADSLTYPGRLPECAQRKPENGH
jgi:hypothetical protein